MKKTLMIILLMISFAIAVVFTGCSKQSLPHREVMNYEQVVKLLGAQNAFEVFDRAGLTEPSTDTGPIARTTGKKVKNGATIVVWFDDLALSVTGSTIEYSTVPGSNWGGVTKFLSQTNNDGAIGIWNCNRYWRDDETVPPTITCTDTVVSGDNLRAFVSINSTGEIHVSRWVVIP